MSKTVVDRSVIIGLHAGAETGPKRAFRKWEGTIAHIQNLGATAVLLNKGVAFDETGQAAKALVLGSSVAEAHSEVNTQQVHAIRDYTGKLALAHAIPTLNEPGIRALLQDKQRFYTTFSEVTAQTAIVSDHRSIHAIDDFLGNVPGEHVVVKPAAGHEGSGVAYVAKTNVQNDLTERLATSPDMPILVQEALDTRSMPGNIKCLTDRDQAILGSGIVAQELRLFSSNTVMTPVLRVDTQQVQGHDSEYVYIDPDTVPEEAYHLGTTVIQKALETSGSRNIFCALDLVYQQATESWRVMEVNVKEPGMPNRDEGAGIGDMIHRQLAAQLVTMAVN